MNGGTAVQPREMTLNDRIHEQVKFLNELCSRAEAMLDRVTPRPTSRDKIPHSDARSPMVVVIERLELACQRLHRITQELSKIA